MKNYFHSILFLAVVLSARANAAKGGFIAEEHLLVSNGQGISSPSFWDGLEGENPAGLVFNQSVKLQAGAGSYSSTAGKTPTMGSGALLIGNGFIGAGVEYQSFQNYLGNGSTQGKINWGIAGRIEAVSSTFGLSSHTTLNGGGATYDLGIMVEPTRQLRVAFMLPGLTFTSPITIHSFAGGITFLMDSAFDLVVDADYNTNASSGMVKPGITFRTQRFQATVAYGVRYTGHTDVVLSQGFSAGLGVSVIGPVLLSYEYRGQLEHRLGLTLRFN